MEFKDNLKYFRAQKEWQQQDLATKMDVSAKTISSWETGRTEPTLGQLAKLAEVLDCSMDTLAGTGTRNVKAITSEELYMKVSTMEDRRTLIYIHQLSEKRLNELREKEEIEREIAQHARRLAELERRAAKINNTPTALPPLPDDESNYPHKPIAAN